MSSRRESPGSRSKSSKAYSSCSSYKQATTPGKVTRVVQRYAGVQNRAAHDEPVQAIGASEGDVGDAAAQGVQGTGGSLPHQEAIQRAFGAHDVSRVTAYSGAPAADACDQIGAAAYATGNKIAFRGSPDLHTAAHEAAHVVQQRGGVQLKGGVGRAGDTYERHADDIADAVVGGRSAESLLDQMSGGVGQHSHSAVLAEPAVQMKTPPTIATQVSNKITDLPYVWTSKYEVKFVGKECQVVIKAKLDRQAGCTKAMATQVATRASAYFKKIWDSKFVLTDTATKKAYTLRASVVFVASGEHVKIKLHPGGDGSTTGTPVLWYVGWPDVDYAHELGHQLGLKDEYIDATAKDRKDGSAPGVHTDNSIMGNYYSEGKAKAGAKLRHGKAIGGHIAGKTGVNFVIAKK